jgi:hypothetical protein
MIPLCNCTALSKPDVYPKSYGSAMVCVIKNCRYHPTSILRQNLREVLSRFVGVKQPTRAGIDLGIGFKPHRPLDEIKPSFQTINPAPEPIHIAVAALAFTDALVGTHLLSNRRWR